MGVEPEEEMVWPRNSTEDLAQGRPPGGGRGPPSDAVGVWGDPGWQSECVYVDEHKRKAC